MPHHWVQLLVLHTNHQIPKIEVNFLSYLICSFKCISSTNLCDLLSVIASSLAKGLNRIAAAEKRSYVFT